MYIPRCIKPTERYNCFHMFAMVPRHFSLPPVTMAENISERKAEEAELPESKHEELGECNKIVEVKTKVYISHSLSSCLTMNSYIL